jgi:hypothetical protein
MSLCLSVSLSLCLSVCLRLSLSGAFSLSSTGFSLHPSRLTAVFLESLLKSAFLLDAVTTPPHLGLGALASPVRQRAVSMAECAARMAHVSVPRASRGTSVPMLSSRQVRSYGLWLGSALFCVDSVGLYVCMSVCLSVCLCVCLCVCLNRIHTLSQATNNL